VRYCGLPSKLNIATLEQLFTLRANDGFVEAFGPALIAEMATIAPGVTLRFAAKPEKSAAFARRTGRY
jgi:hypothetical protein